MIFQELLTDTRLVCTHLNAFFMLNPNMAMKIQNFENFLKSFNKIICCLHTSIQWRSDWVAWVDNVQGPGAKRVPREREIKKKKEEKKNRKEKKEKKKKREEKEKEEKRERNFSNTWTGAPTRYFPMSQSRWQKIPKSNIDHHTIFEIGEKWRIRGPCILFQLA